MPKPDPNLIDRFRDLPEERAALGHVINHPEDFAKCQQAGYYPDLFGDSQHQWIWQAMIGLAEAYVDPDVPAIRRWLIDHHRDVPTPYLTSLGDGLPRQGSENITARGAHLDVLRRCRQYIYEGQSLDAKLADDPSLLNNGFLAHRIGQLHALQAADPHPAPPVLLNDATVLSLPAPVSLIPGRLPAEALACLFGPPGIGKTFVALDLALSFAAAVPWLGVPVPAASPVVYLCAEGAPGLTLRIRHWKLAHQVPLSTVLGVHLWSGPVSLLDDTAVTHFITALSTYQPKLVILDTLARCMVGGDENSAKDMGLAIAAADRIRTRLNATVLAIHHSNKTGAAERGSGALRGACDTMFELTLADDLLTLSCSKQKDGESFLPQDLKLVSAVPNGQSRVVRLASDADASTALSDAQGKALHVLREVFGDRGATMAEWLDSIPNLSKATLYRARTVLLHTRAVREHNRRFFAQAYTPAFPDLN